MKKQLLALLLAGLGVNSAFAAPSLYGKLDVSVDRIDYDQGSSNNDNWKVDSNNSLFGIKGDEKLTDDLSAFYLIEWQVNVDGDGNDLGQRNRYVGIKSEKFGAAKIGKYDSYVKRLGVDFFDNYVANSVDISGTLTGENRLNNTVSYETPVLKTTNGDFQFNALLAAGEDNNDGAVVNGAGDSSGKNLADAWSTSITYKNVNGISAGLGYDSGVASRWLGVAGVPIVTTNLVRASGSLNIKDVGLTLIGLVQNATVDHANTTNIAGAAVRALLDNVDNELGYVLGASYKIPNYDKVSVKAQYNHATTSYKNATKDYDVDQIAAGVDYAFNSKTRAYGFLAQNNKDNGTADNKTRYGGVGLELKF